MPSPTTRHGAPHDELSRGRIIARITSCASIVLLLVVAWLSRDEILETWHLHRLGSDDRRAREHAATSLGRLRSTAAVPRILELVTEEKISANAAVEALGSIGSAARPALLESLRDGRQDLRAVAIESLLRVGDERLRAIGDTFRGMSRREVRSVQPVARLGDPPEEVIAALVGLLRDREWDARETAATSLGGLGIAARDARPALIEALGDPDPEVAGRAAIALAQVSVNPALAVAPLVGALANVRARRPRALVIRSIGELGPRAAPAVSRLIEILETEPEHRSVTTRALREIGPAAAPAVPALLDVARVADRRLAEAAAGAAGEIADGREEFLPGIIAILGERGDVVGPSLVTPLRRFGEAAVEPLIRLLPPHVEEPIPSVFHALSSLGSRSRAAVPALLALLEAEDATLSHGDRWHLTLHGAVVHTLGQIGPGAAAAVPALEDYLQELPDDKRRRVFLALGDIGPAALPRLLEFLEEGNVELRIGALQAIARIGPAAREAVPHIVEALSSPRTELFAVWALGSIGPGARAAVPRLEALIESDGDRVIRPARAALHAIDPRGAGRRFAREWRTTSDDVVRKAREADADAPPRFDARRPDDRGHSKARGRAREGVDSGSSVRFGPIPEPVADDAGPVIDRLVRFGRPRNLVIAALEEAMSSDVAAEDVVVRMHVLDGLDRLGDGRDRDLIATLVRVLELDPSRFESIIYLDELPNVRYGAASILARLGARARAALPAVEKALGDDYAALRVQLAVALWKMKGPTALERSVAVILEVLRDARPLYGFSVLRQMEDEIREEVARGLAAIGPPAVPLLLPHLDSDDERLRWRLLDVLAFMGPDAEAARSRILARLADEHFLVRDFAAHAILALGVREEDLPSLRALLEHEDKYVRLTAAGVLERIEDSERARDGEALVDGR